MERCVRAGRCTFLSPTHLKLVSVFTSSDGNDLTCGRRCGRVRSDGMKTFHSGRCGVRYEELSALLCPQQFKQMEVVRENLLQDPTGLDRAKPTQAEEATNGKAEEVTECQ